VANPRSRPIRERGTCYDIAVAEDVDKPPVVAEPKAAEAVALPPKKLSLKERLKATFTEYPKIAVIIYLACSAVAVAGFSIAIGIGAEPSTATGVIGVIGAGWLAAKVTVPLRILATLALTPPIAALVNRRKKNKPPAPDDDLDDDDAAS
jgi:hypothetical protein